MGRRTRVKFCGITRPADAAAAAAAGADAVGLVLYPSTLGRAVGYHAAREILAAVPPFVTPVGLFVDASPVEVGETSGELDLRVVQLHGDETPEQVADVCQIRSVIKAIRCDVAGLAAELARWRDVPVDALLLEAAGGGGTGVANDWAGLAAARAAGALDGLPPVVVAGGLTPESVGGVVRALRPFAVDVSSGIEASRGVKSAERMAAFMAAVADADLRDD